MHNMKWFVNMRFIGLMLFLAIVLIPIIPFHDDWWYLTAPNIHFTLRDLLPAQSFWRPFDALFGGALGVMPFCFPWANKIAIVLAHALNIGLLDRVLRQFWHDDSRTNAQRRFALCIMAFSSATVASLVNTDTINQVWCITWGLYGTFLILRKEGTQYPISAIACFFISIVVKESGASWLAVAPLMDYIRTRDLKTLCRRAFVGALVLAVYFGLRFLLQGSFVLSGDEYYAFSFAPTRVMVNFLIGMLMGCSAIDGLAFFSGKHILFAITVCLSLAGWLFLLVSLFRYNGLENIRRLILGLLIVLSFAAPHCFFKYFHPAELHMYSIVAGVAILIGCMKFSSGRIFGIYLGAVCFAGLFMIGWVDKIGAIYKRSQRTREVLRKIEEAKVSLEEDVVFVIDEDPSICCYSVFSQSVIHGLGKNKALRSLNGWRDTKAKVITTKAVPSLPAQTRVIRLD